MPRVTAKHMNGGALCRLAQLRVLTARLGCIYTQFLSHIVPRWVAEEAAVGRSLAAVVEMKSQNSSSRPCVWRFPMGGSILVHRGACVSHSVHGWQGGHQQHATFNQLNAECQQTELWVFLLKQSVMNPIL